MARRFSLSAFAALSIYQIWFWKMRSSVVSERQNTYTLHTE